MTEESIFHAALERADPAERSAYLNEACAGDTDLRRRVEGLLKAHDTATGFLEPAPQDIPASAHEPARAAPTLPDSQDAAERMDLEATHADADDREPFGARPRPAVHRRRTGHAHWPLQAARKDRRRRAWASSTWPSRKCPFAAASR